MNTDLCATLIQPDWPAPANVKACMTTREGGVSQGAYASLNLGDHVNDDPNCVAQNRARLTHALPAEPIWLTQVHGTDVVNAALCAPNTEADASFTTAANVVSCVMTADCLPVLFCNKEGSLVAAAHAGWRGLLDGILEATLVKFDDPADVMIWLGAAIGPRAFEVGSEVRAAFVARNPEASEYFLVAGATKYMANIYELAKMRLQQAGVPSGQMYGAEGCTFTDENRFFSYRRDGQTGRMATCIWLTEG